MRVKPIADSLSTAEFCSLLIDALYGPPRALYCHDTTPLSQFLRLKANRTTGELQTISETTGKGFTALGHATSTTHMTDQL